MGHKTETGYLWLADSIGHTSFVAQTQIEHAGMVLSVLLETIIKKLSHLLTISKLEGDAVNVETYCSVCGLELCYTEYVINNWISVVPLAADPLIGLRSFLFPAVPDMCPLG